MGRLNGHFIHVDVQKKIGGFCFIFFFVCSTRSTHRIEEQKIKFMKVKFISCPYHSQP